MARFSARPTHSRVASPVWVPGGMEESVSRQESKVFPLAVRRLCGASGGSRRRGRGSPLPVGPGRLRRGPTVELWRSRARRGRSPGGRAAASASALRATRQAGRSRCRSCRSCRSWWRVVAGSLRWWSSRQVRSAEGGPGAGAGLDGVLLVCDDQRRGGGAGGLMLDDGEQVAVGEPARGGGGPECGVDPCVADQGSELDRSVHLGSDALRAGGGGLDQPRVRAGAEGEERLLGVAAGPDLRWLR